MSDNDSSEATELQVIDSSQTSLNTPTAAADLSHTLHHHIMSSSGESVSRPVRALDGHPPDTKSKNAKPNPTTRLNVVKLYNYYIYIIIDKQFV